MKDASGPPRRPIAPILSLCAVGLLLLALRFQSNTLGVMSLLVATGTLVLSIASLLRGVRILASVTALLGLICWGVLLPPIGTGQPPSRRSRCALALKQIGYGLHLYSSENDEAFPPRLVDLYNGEPRHIADPALLVCPAAADRVRPFDPALGEPLTEENISYCYVSGSSAADEHWCIAAFCEESNHHHDGTNVLYIGGSVGLWIDLNWLHDQLAKQLRRGGKTIIRPAWSDTPEDGLSRR